MGMIATIPSRSASVAAFGAYGWNELCGLVADFCEVKASLHRATPASRRRAGLAVPPRTQGCRAGPERCQQHPCPVLAVKELDADLL